MTGGLDRETWTDALGVARVDWEEALDRSVYNTGLRVLHCPKARSAPRAHQKPTRRARPAASSTTATRSTRASTARANVKALERRARAASSARELHAPLTRLVRATSVRVDARAEHEVTPGYRVYDGCPPLRVGTAAGKRKRPGAPSASSDRLCGACRAPTASAGVTDPARLAIMRRLVAQHTPGVRQSTLRVRLAESKGVGRYSVLLSGDGARYCTNKRDYHRSNNVHMEVWRDRNHLHGGVRSVMRCWCRCPAVRAGGGPGTARVPWWPSPPPTRRSFPAPAQGAAAAAAAARARGPVRQPGVAAGATAPTASTAAGAGRQIARAMRRRRGAAAARR